MPIRTKRVYEKLNLEGGERVLVDRLWPRGVSKERAHLNDWAKDVAPSDDLRKWFDHDPEKWASFEARYRDELRQKEDPVDDLLAKARSDQLVLVYAAKDTEHNNAVVLQRFLEERLTKRY